MNYTTYFSIYSIDTNHDKLQCLCTCTKDSCSTILSPQRDSINLARAHLSMDILTISTMHMTTKLSYAEPGCKIAKKYHRKMIMISRTLVHLPKHIYTTRQIPHEVLSCRMKKQCSDLFKGSMNVQLHMLILFH